MQTIEELIQEGTENLTIMFKQLGKQLLKKEDRLEKETMAGTRQYMQMLYALQRLSKQPNESGGRGKAFRLPLTDPPEIPQQWKDDPITFAKEALQIDPHQEQQKLLRANKRINLFVAGRGAGKSTAAGVKALYRAMMNEKHTVLVVSTGQRMSNEFGDKIKELINENEIQQWVVSSTKEKVVFTNGSVIKFLPCNPSTIRGYHPKSTNRKSGITIILDEACYMNNGDEIRQAVEYAIITTDTPNGQIVITTSPSNKRSWVYHLYKNQKDNIEIIQCASTANPSIDAIEIERLKDTKTESEYRAEVMGEWVDGAFSLFSGVIDPNIVDVDPKSFPKDAICTLGADLAISYQKTNDNNALVVVAKWWDDTNPDTEARYRIVDCKILDRPSDNRVRDAVKELIETYQIEFSAIEQFQGKGIHEYCESFKVESELIHPNSGLQTTVFHEMYRLFSQNLIEIPKTIHPQLIDELKNFEYAHNESGRITYSHADNEHDDTVYALAWAIHVAIKADYRNRPARTKVVFKTIPHKSGFP
jgi:hypothetical protein